MIHIDEEKHESVLSGTMMTIINEFMNCANGIFTSMSEDLGEARARGILSRCFEKAISKKSDNMLKIVTPAEK